MLAQRHKSLFETPAYRGGIEALERDPNLMVAWFLDNDDPVVPRTVHPAYAEGPRNLFQNTGLDSTSGFTIGAGWAISGGLGVATNSSASLTRPHAVIGKLFRIKYDVVAYTSGSVRAVAGTTNGVSRTAIGSYSEIVYCVGNTNIGVNGVGFTGSVDNIEVYLVNIPGSTPSLGIQLLIDGDQEAPTAAAWSTSGTPTVTKVSSGQFEGAQAIQIARNGNNNPYIFQTVLEIGKRYRLLGKAKSLGTATPRAGQVGIGDLWVGIASANWQSFELGFVALDTRLYFMANTSSGTEAVQFDALRLVEDLTVFPGERCFDGNMALSYVTGSWIAGANAVITKETASPPPDSINLQYLKVARNATNNPDARKAFFIAGKRYRVKGKCQGDGSAVPTLFAGTAGAAFTGVATAAWQSFNIVVDAVNDLLILRSATSTGNQFTLWADIEIEEISPFAGRNVNGVITGVGAGYPAVKKAWKGNGSNACVDIYSQELAAAFIPSLFTAWALVYVSMDDFANATTWDFLNIGNAVASSYTRIAKGGSGGGWHLRYGYNSAGAATINTTKLARPGWHFLSTTLNFAELRFRGYVDGSLVGVAVPAQEWSSFSHPLPANCCLFSRATSGQPFSPSLMAGAGFVNGEMPPEWHRQQADRFCLLNAA